MAQLTRLFFSDFLSRSADTGAAAAVIQTKYGRLIFETKEEFISFQLDCPHSSARWVHGGHESFVCERCWAVLETGWPDDHPAISRWLNDGGSGSPLDN